MTARELLIRQLETAEHQLLMAIDGLTAEEAEARATPQSFSIYEQIAHLAETCVALENTRAGREHVWGEWSPRDPSWDGAKSEWRERRSALVAATGDEETDLLVTSGFLVEHDFYHVGSIVAARLTVQPEWDSGALYQ